MEIGGLRWRWLWPRAEEETTFQRPCSEFRSLMEVSLNSQPYPFFMISGWLCKNQQEKTY